MPAMERRRRTRYGFLPPVVSTQAEKGIRNRDPEREGAATRSPTSRGVSPRIPLKLFAVGPKRETAAKPMKNPRVAPASPWAGVPFVAATGIPSCVIPAPGASTRLLASFARVIPPVDRRGDDVVCTDSEEERNGRAESHNHGPDQRCKEKRTVRR